MELGPRQKQWIEDIPKYPQAHGVLCDGYGFCCLGVYAQTQIPSKWEITWDGVYVTDTESSVLPASARQALHLRSKSGGFKVPLTWKNSTYISLATLNDSQKITPKQMAKFIKDNAKYIFKEAA